MPKNKKMVGLMEKAKPYIIGTIRGSVVFSIFYIILAFFMNKTNVDLPVLYYLVYLFIVFGGFVCGVYVYKKVRGRGFLTGILSSVPYSVVVFLVFCLVNGFNISGNILLVFLLTASGGFLGGVTAANTRI